MPETEWIFGYGSLIWKVDFPYFRKSVGYIKGFKRRFWLASTDHRGVPESPGRVVTLIASENPEEKVWGVAYEIPTDEKTRNDLDHREKGGYTRHATIYHQTSPPVDVSSPLSPTAIPTSSASSSTSFSLIPVVVFIATSDVEEYLGPQSMESLAQVISTSIGPSGKNSDYLFNLADAVRTYFPELEDEHLFRLEKMVKERLQDRKEHKMIDSS